MAVETDIGILRAKFMEAYASVPEKLRGEIIAVINDKTYSWDAAFVEVKGKTFLGDEIVRKLENIGLFEGI
jgi:hypothetical protein